ncbi:polycystic kidney disease protein 1-like [Homalodisca vitripennis]|nr:polycystic kidney disease protein 1-like [Homalodisca vitripennis]
MLERRKRLGTLDFGFEIEIAQVQILSVTVAFFISTIDLVLLDSWNLESCSSEDIQRKSTTNKIKTKNVYLFDIRDTYKKLRVFVVDFLWISSDDSRFQESSLRQRQIPYSAIKGRNFLDCVDIAVLARDESITLAPEEDVDYKALNNLKRASACLAEVIQISVRVVSHFQTAGDTRTEFPSHEKLSHVWAAIDQADVLSDKKDEDMRVQMDKKLANSFRMGLDLTLHYATLKQNLFWWARSYINTDIVFMELAQKVLGHVYHAVPVLHKPIDIYMNVTKLEKGVVSEKVTQVDPNMDFIDRDLNLVVHRIITPPLSRLYITFKFDDDSALRVVIEQGKRPDYDSVVERPQKLSKENPVLEIPYNVLETENYYYMAILPASEVPVNTSMSYSFEIYYMLCQVWEKQWSNHYCLIGNQTTESRMHCLCTHMSFFAGAIAVPPNDINPFSDAHLFLTVFDNPWVVAFVLIILLLFLLALLWAAYKDRKDKLFEQPPEVFLCISVTPCICYSWSGDIRTEHN